MRNVLRFLAWTAVGFATLFLTVVVLVYLEKFVPWLLVFILAAIVGQIFRGEMEDYL